VNSYPSTGGLIIR